jgi:hypothetical protein
LQTLNLRENFKIRYNSETYEAHVAKVHEHHSTVNIHQHSPESNLGS